MAENLNLLQPGVGTPAGHVDGRDFIDHFPSAVDDEQAMSQPERIIDDGFAGCLLEVPRQNLPARWPGEAYGGYATFARWCDRGDDCLVAPMRKLVVALIQMITPF